MSRHAPQYAPLEPTPADLPAEALCADGNLSLVQAAAFAAVPKRTMERLVATEKVPSLKIGRRRVVPKRGLVAYLAQLDREQTGAR